MQGFILNIKKVKEEDLVVTILTKTEILTLYRFYGARHSIINIGYFIDFEIESNIKSRIDRLRDVMQINVPFLLNIDSMIIWQQYIKLIYKHLKDITTVPNFYFEHLITISSQINRNPKRVIIENFIKLLDYEGRLFQDFHCFNCEKEIKNNLVLITAFLPSCKECVKQATFNIDKIKNMFETKKTVLLDDYEIDRLYEILCKGV